MRRTPTTPERAVRSANSRLTWNQDELQKAYAKDVADGPAGKQKWQWRAATEWLRSEVTALDDEARQKLLNHVIVLCQDANTQARMSVVQTESRV